MGFPIPGALPELAQFSRREGRDQREPQDAEEDSYPEQQFTRGEHGLALTGTAS